MDTALCSDENVVVHDRFDEKSCRLCCSEERSDLRLIFPADVSCNSNKFLLEKIFECTAVQITNEGDDQNALICRDCVDKIDDFYTYRQQCQENDDRIRKRAHRTSQIRVKQEKDLQLEITINESIPSCEDEFLQEESSQPRLSSYSTANEFQHSSEIEPGKDGEESLLQPMSSSTHHTISSLNHLALTDEITIKRETIVDDDDVYYNSDGEIADPQKHSAQNQTGNQLEVTAGSSNCTSSKAQYRIVMNASNRERLVYQGYLYCRHFTRRDGSIHWRCRLGGCQAAVNLQSDGTIAHANTHGHCHPQNGLDDDIGGLEPSAVDDENDIPIVDDEPSFEHFEEDDTQEDINDSEPVAVSSDSLQIVPNKKKGETLVHLGFKYCKRYLKMDGSTFWKCRSNNNKCSAGVYVYPDSRVKYHGIHNHEKVVNEGQEGDHDNSIEGEMEQPYTIIEDVEDDEEPEQSPADDMAALLTSSVEVMMPADKKQIKKDYEITTNVKGRECLIYEGHQYSKDRERVDGAVFWRCRRNYDKCRAMAIVYNNGKVEKCGEHHHETDKRYLERQEQGAGSRMYRITKNQRGNDALVFDGHRFSKEWSRVNGSIIWRCSYKSGICKMKVVLNADGYVHHMGPDHEHDHEKTETPVTEEYAIEEDVQIVEDSLITPARNQQKAVPSQPSLSCPNFTPEQQAAGGYRIVKNRKGFEALVHDGFRYCKVRVRQDGSVKWLCKMNKKTCRAAVDLFPDGSVVKASEYDHNHERPTDMDTIEDDEEAESSTFETFYPIDPEVFGNSQWYYVKNSKNGISMIHAGYRYTKKCDRVDGTSLWRCSASQRGCKAGVILFPNDTLAMVENAEHSHKPYESVKPSENESEMLDTKKQKTDSNEVNESDRTADENDIAMHSLLQTVLGGEEVPWMGGETENEPTNESVWFNSAADRPYPRPSGPPNFRIIKNRRNTDSLVHRGYRYCKIRDRQDGSILWACQMNKKTCKASVNLTTDGHVEVINGKHNHQKTDVDDTDERQRENVVDSASDVEVTVEEPAKPQPVTKPSRHPDYYYSVNKSNRECLIHKGYRFCKRSDRPDGSTVWRCSMGGNTCMVVVTVAADGTPEQNSIIHNHRPLEELPPAIERAAKPPSHLSATEESNQNSTFNRHGDSLEWRGFHYRKIKELPDKSIIWICQVDSCRVAVKMLPNNHLKMLSESEHNHTAPGTLPSNSTGNTSGKSGSTLAGKTRSYRLFKNSKGQMTLVYHGYRYSIRNRNQDGSSSWKCRANATCRVVIHLMPDDRIVPEKGNSEHNHEPNMETNKKTDAVAQTRVNPLYDYLNIIPGGSTQPTQLQEPEMETNTLQSAQHTSSDSTSYARNVIEHKGYYYRLVVRKKNGREYWRCVHFKNRACRAALFCRDNGTVVTSSNGKEHSHSGGANGKPLPSMAGSFQNKPSISSGLLQGRTAAQPSPPQEVSLVRGDEERYIDHGDYVIAKNRKDQNTLIFKDRRYYLSYNRSDGSAVWRCAHRKRYKCYAYVRLRPDGRLLSTGEHEHSHAINNSGQATVTTSVVPEAKETRNYKIVKNRVGNDILIHDNHRFRLNYQRNDGTTHWRCIWARSNHCSAGVYLLINGVLKNAANEAQIIHNHPPPSQVKRTTVTKDDTQTNSEDQNHSQSHSTNSNGDQNRTIPETDGITDYKFIEEGSNKILICRGYRYWYTWIRKDGSIYYRCAEVKRLQCPMGTLLLSNGKLVRANDHCHNHAPSQDEAEEEFLGFPVDTQSSVVVQEDDPLEQHPPLPIPSDGDDDYKIVKTSRGESLIYRGYRYWAKNRLANGIISLCCTRKKMKKCPAMLRLLTNGRIIDPVGVGHTHSPNCDGSGMPELSVSSTLVQASPMQPIKLSTPKEQVKSKMSSQVTPKLPALSFNEESEDEAEQGDESLIGSRRYIFMKSSSQRNFIVFEGFVYDFEHKQHDGCVFYRCKTNEACPASLMLLTNGRVMNLDDSLHMHEKPDLSNLREVGRGSKEFKIVQNKNGSNILVHRGHRYTTPRAKTDGAGIWYCHTYVPSINRRCYVPIELLPNGRVAPVSEKQHHHSAPFKTKQEMSASQSTDAKNTSVIIKTENVDSDSKSDNRMLLLGGHRYTYAHERDDGAVLWKCAKSSCNASMYRLTDGQVVKGPDHNHDKLGTSDSPRGHKRKHAELETKPKTSSPIVSGGDSNTGSPVKADPHGKHPYIGQSITHDGYRYTFYLTRKDGSEHWRCCRRVPLKCRGGIFKQTDGTLIPTNDEGHSHPPGEHDSDETGLKLYTLPEDVSQDSIDSQEPEEATDSVSYLEDEGSYDYELVDVKGKKRGFYLIHKGAMFVAGHTRRDRARYYRCRTVGCKVAMLLHRNGLLVRTNEHTHDCQNAVKTDDADKTDADDHDEEQIESTNSKKQRIAEEIEEDEEDDDDDNDNENMGELPEVAPQKVIEDDHVTNGSDDVVVEVKEEPVDT
ncbi:uncharacterized protein LOC128734997 isoform X2 [Sabethes cyaneus]|uniref:uncharacterized protein LOC128734997 isoform X2 n=1 Tax=Sabethes cyaneus TaxID=53552 RepID=UPI00237E0145|nr:uncharacterized protein LOC128734997 isoform X2 [Sabethes cyaneus]